ncbi:MAG: signal peptide peptidase SppA [Phycisphaeraceae bacterium]
MAENQPQGSGSAGGAPSGRGPVNPRDASSTPPSPPPNYVPMQMAPAKRGVLGKVGTSLLATVVLVSLLANVYLGMIVAAYTSGGPRESEYEAGESGPRIVVLPIEEMVTDSTYEFVRQSLRSLEKDTPAAVVLRIDCPGGTVAASDRVWHELTQFKEKTGIPIVASFGSVAASGGYYIAAPADTIFAEPTTITGSIGVIVMGFTVEELLEKIGVTPEVVTSAGSTKKDELLPMRAWTDAERDALRETRLDPAYERFVHVVHQGRSHVLNEEEVRERATGEVFAAQQAKDLNLVDDIGYLGDAIAFAKTSAGLAESAQPRVTILRQPSGFGLGSLLATSGSDWSQVQHFSQLSPEQARAWVVEMAAPQMMYAGPMR